MSIAYQVITEAIIARLEKGIIPWKKGWNGSNDLPTNLISKKAYRGLNVFLLASMGYGSKYWLTFNQIKKKGGFLKKGEKSCPVTFWTFIEKDKKGNLLDKKIPFLRYYRVFNIEQTEGIEMPKENATEKLVFNPIEKAEKILAEMPKIEIQHKDNRAYYNKAQDFINMPKKENFHSTEGYYATLFHEVVHSTGSLKKLNRKSLIESQTFGDHSYSKEELVAELGACFLNSECEIESNFENSTAYIQSWVKALKNDNKLIMQASSFATKAVNFVMNIKNEYKKVDKNEKTLTA